MRESGQAICPVDRMTKREANLKFGGYFMASPTRDASAVKDGKRSVVLPATKNDFYDLVESLPAEESAVVKRVRAFTETKIALILCLILAAPGLLWGQASAQKADSPQNDSDVAAELKTLREALSQTQKQVALQQQEIEALKTQSRAEQ